MGICNILKKLFTLASLACFFLPLKKMSARDSLSLWRFSFSFSLPPSLTHACTRCFFFCQLAKPILSISWVTVSLGDTGHQPAYSHRQNGSAEALQCPRDADSREPWALTPLHPLSCWRSFGAGQSSQAPKDPEMQRHGQLHGDGVLESNLAGAGRHGLTVDRVHVCKVKRSSRWLTATECLRRQ